jgi:hypothetical protein
MLISSSSSSSTNSATVAAAMAGAVVIVQLLTPADPIGVTFRFLRQLRGHVSTIQYCTTRLVGAMTLCLVV